MNKWFIFGFVIYLLLLIGGGFFLGSEIFWGVFVASFLGFLGSIFVEKWLEDKGNQKELQAQGQENMHTINVIKDEIAENLVTAKRIKEYLNNYSGMAPNEFSVRIDAIFLGFSDVSRKSLWTRMARAVNDATVLKDIASLYANYDYIIYLLNVVRGYISKKVSSGAMDYKMALQTNPWNIQLYNGLAKVINESESLLKKI